MTSGGLIGLRVLALENRRTVEIAKLIGNYGGQPTVTPAMREIPLESNHEALAFAGRLIEGGFDLVIFTTGVGARRLVEIAELRYQREQIIEALRRIKTATRGPKSSAVLRELGIPITVTAPDPSTWRELVDALERALGPALSGLRAAVQEYGASNPELLDALTEHGVDWTRVPVYQWALPEDIEPLRNSIRSIAAGGFDVVIFLNAVHVLHLFQVAEEMGMAGSVREAMRKMAVLSIGPSTSAELARHDLRPDLEPSHPKMGFLMNEAAQFVPRLLEEKRSNAARANSAHGGPASLA